MNSGCNFQKQNGVMVKTSDECHGRCTAPDPEGYAEGMVVYVTCDL